MTAATTKNRLFLMDDIKLLASYFVVFIHFVFPGNFGIAIKAIARFAVPFFFMCSGYFLYGNTPDIILKKAFRILKLFLITILIYMCWELSVYLIGQEYDAIWSYISNNFFNYRKLLKLVLFNVPPICTFLWYLLAMFYVYVIYYFIAKFNFPDSVICISSILLLFLHLLIWHLLLIYQITEDTFYVRNFLFVGYPFVSIGRILKKHQHKLPCLKTRVILILLTTGCICSILSRFTFGSKSLPFGAIIISVTLMLVCITTAHPQKPIIANAGIYSTYIYLFHQLVKKWYFLFLSITGITNELFWDLSPIFICVTTTIFVLICTSFRNKILRLFPTKTI